MKKIWLLTIPFLLSAGSVSAQDLSYPTTKSEIVKALQFKKATTVHKGITYEVTEDGQKFMIIGGKRFRMRGIGKIVDSEIIPKIGAKISFSVNSSSVKSDSLNILDELAEALVDPALADAKIQISGHTDSQGNDSFNLRLSQDRSESVKDYFVSKGINPHRLISKGYGESKPVANNDEAAGRAENRRVEIIRIE